MIPQDGLILSRRELLQQAGVLIVGFSLLGRDASAAAPFVPKTPWAADPGRIDSWITIHANNTATVYFSKVEVGQGTMTGLLQIAGEELDLELDQLAQGQVDTLRSPDQWGTVASVGIERGGAEVRAAAAEARLALLRLAADRLTAPIDQLTVTRGLVSVVAEPRRSISYGDLIGGRTFDVRLTGSAPQKARAQYRLAGKSVPRVEVPDIVAARFQYMQQVRVPGMLHGRVVRPAGQAAYGTYFRVVAVDPDSIAMIPDVQVVRKGDFIGVVAAVEWNAVKAARQLKVDWRVVESLSGHANLHERMRAASTADSIVSEQGDSEAGWTAAAHRVSASYRAPYQSHAPFAPNCAIADVRAESATVICSSTQVFTTAEMVAKVIGIPPVKVQVRYVEGSGTYGRSNFDDASQAAAILSQSVGKPVRVQLMRGDEIAWDAYGPAHVAETRAGADLEGKIVAYDYHGWQHGWMSVEPTEELLLGTKPSNPPVHPAARVNPFNAGAMYDLPNKRMTNHHLSGLDGFLRGSFLRSPMDLALSFASEQTIDELAVACQMDSVAFRRQNMSHPRWLGVLDAVVQGSTWQPRVAASARSSGDLARGRGVGLGTHFESYGAAVADVEVRRSTGEVFVRHVYGALDPGFVVNPASVENQIIGMSMQAVSRVLKEEVQFDRSMVLSRDWNSYPVLRYAESPQVTPLVVNSPDQPSTGAGEEMMGACVAAIANAFFDATGVRMREYPMTPARVLQTLRT